MFFHHCIYLFNLRLCAACIATRPFSLGAPSRLPVAVSSPVAGHGLLVAAAQRVSRCGSRAPGHRLNSCGARGFVAVRPRAMWDLPGSGIEPSLLHQQEDSLPVSHQGSPKRLIFNDDMILLNNCKNYL